MGIEYLNHYGKLVTSVALSRSAVKRGWGFSKGNQPKDSCTILEKRPLGMTHVLAYEQSVKDRDSYENSAHVFRFFLILPSPKTPQPTHAVADGPQYDRDIPPPHPPSK